MTNVSCQTVDCDPESHRALTRHLLFAVVSGGAAGIILGKSAAPLGVIGLLIIQFIKTMAVPLVFFAIIDGILTTHISSSKAVHLFKIVLINSLIAATIGMTLSNVIQPGVGLEKILAPSGAELPPTPIKEINLKNVLSGFVPSSIVAPFSENNVLGIVVLALLIGFATRSIQQSEKKDLVPFFKYGMVVFDTILRWAITFIPIGVFAAMAKTVGEYGFGPFKNLGWYVLVATFGLILQVVFVYSCWLFVVAKIPVRTFFSAAKKPLLYAFGVNSSLATIPLTLHALDSLKVTRASSRLGACIGTNFNNDGILLYEAMAVLFVTQAYGIDMPLTQQAFTALLCVIAAIGVAGIPEAGIVSLSLVLATVGLPIEILPLLLTVDWFVARLRSVVNVWSDMTVSIALDAYEKV